MKPLVLIALLALVVVVSGCTQAPAAGTPVPTATLTPAATVSPEPTASEAATPAGTASATPTGTSPAAVKEFSVAARRFAFAPNEFTVRQGDTVRFRVTSQDTEHGFFVSGYNKEMRIMPGTVGVLEFVADTKGTFNVFCSVFCGSGHGDMKATLIVE